MGFRNKFEMTQRIRIMKRPVYLIIFIAIVIVGLTLAQISVGNQISTTGTELSKLQKQVTDYERENAILQEEILNTSSYTNISEKADELGYAPNTTVINLNVAPPLAMKQ